MPRRLEIAIQVLIVLNLIAFAIETVPGLSPAWRSFLRTFEIATVIIFSIEYLARLYLAKPKGTYALSFFGIVDLLAILPFFLSLGIDLRSLRAFRLLRLFMLFKLARYNKALSRYREAFLSVKEELIIFAVAAAITVYLAAVGIYFCEHTAQPETFSSVFHSLWWAVSTLTTVGYGDTYPVTAGGKIFTVLILAVGLGVVAISQRIVCRRSHSSTQNRGRMEVGIWQKLVINRQFPKKKSEFFSKKISPDILNTLRM